MWKRRHTDDTVSNVVGRMLYWSVGGGSMAARYIHRTTIDGAAAADNVQQFVDVTDNSIATASASAVQDIVVDVRTQRSSQQNYVLT